MNTERRKEHTGRMKEHAVLLSAFCIFLLLGCNVYEDTKNCTQGIYVHFYSKTACSADTVYPQVEDLKLYVFDSNGILVSYGEDNNVSMQRDYSRTVDASGGLFTVIAWTGLNNGAFDWKAPEEKVTTKNDLLFRLQRATQQAASLDGKRVYYGESPTVFLPDPAEYGSIFESAKINLQEITNRFTVSVEGLPQAEDYEVVIESANGSMNIDGSIAGDEVIRYPSQPAVKEGILEAKFTVLKLATGYNGTLIVKDKRDNRELYRGDLLGTLLLKNPEVNLACDHDFTIRFTTKDQCDCGTYMIAQIWVNNWLVHSYATEL
ncbi:hypothetical protein FACS189474_5120 [Bacteroidia bacterium]|nr:hypothetical protein FACS189474_5120 [Bacteroidia bacterium]